MATRWGNSKEVEEAKVLSRFETQGAADAARGLFAAQQEKQAVARVEGERLRRERQAAAERARLEGEREAERLRLEAEKRRLEAEARAKAAAEAAEKRRQEAEDKQAREAAKEGVVTEKDPKTGLLRIVRHADGRAKYTAGPVGAPEHVGDGYLSYQPKDAEKPPVKYPLIQSGGSPGPLSMQPEGAPGPWRVEKQAVYQQRMRDERGEEYGVDPATWTDPKTAVKYVIWKDPATQATGKLEVGVDLEQEATNEWNADLKQRQEQLVDRSLEMKRQRREFEPRWEPVKKEYEEAKLERAWFKKTFRSNLAGKWEKIDPATDAPVRYREDELELWQKQQGKIQARYERAKKEYERLAPNARQFDRFDDSLKRTRERLEAEKARRYGGLPRLRRSEAERLEEADEDALAEVDLTVEGGVGGIREWGTIPEKGGRTWPVMDPDDRAGSIRSSFDALKDVDGLKFEDGNGWAAVNREGRRIATLESGGKTSIAVLTDEASPRDVVDMSEVQGMPVYLRENPARRKIEDEVEEVAAIHKAASDPAMWNEDGTARPALNDRLQQLGATPGQIVDGVRSGTLAVQHGEALLKNLYGQSLVEDNPMAPGRYEKWLTEISAAQDKALQDKYGDPRLKADTVGKQLAKATRKKTTDFVPGGPFWSTYSIPEQNRIWNDYVADMYARNRGKPGVTREKYQAMMKRDFSDELSLSERARSMSTAAGNMVLNDAIASTAGIFWGLAKDAFYADPLLGGKKGYTKEMLGLIPESLKKKYPEEFKLREVDPEVEKSMRLRGRSGANFADGAERSAKTWGTKEGIQVNALFDRAVNQFQKTLDEEWDKAEPDQARIYAAEKDVIKTGLALHGLARDEDWPITEANLDASKDAVLGIALARYRQTADLREFQLYKDRLLMSNGRRQLSADMEKETRGSGPFMAAFKGGRYAGWQEVITEMLADAAMVVSAGGSKAIQAGLKATGAVAKAERLANLGTRMAAGLERFNAIGIRTGTLAQPLTGIQRAMNTGVRVAKTAAIAGVGGGTEEVIVEFGEDTPHFGRAFWSGFLTEGVVMTPVFHGVQHAVHGAQVAAAERQELSQNRRAAEEYNVTMAKVRGFQPITAETAGVARGFLNSREVTDLAKRVEAANAAVAAAGVAPETAAVNRTKLENLRREIAKGEGALENARPDRAAAIEGQLGALREQEAALAPRVELAGQSAEARAKARADLDSAVIELAGQQERVVSAASEIQAEADPARRTFLTGIAKVASGNAGQLTKNERAAIQGARTKAGEAYFRNEGGREVLTEAARGELARTSPAVGELVRATEIGALRERVRGTVEGLKNGPVAAVDGAGVSGADGGWARRTLEGTEYVRTPDGRWWSGATQEELAAYARSPQRAVSAGLPAMPGMDTRLEEAYQAARRGQGGRQGQGDGGLAAEGPAGIDPELVDDGSQSARAVLARAVARFLAKYPGMRGKVRVIRAGKGPVMQADSQGVIINLGVADRSFAVFDGRRRDARADGLFDEELVHYAGFQHALDEAGKALSRMTPRARAALVRRWHAGLSAERAAEVGVPSEVHFEKAFVELWHERLWNEFTAEQQRRMAEIYQGNFKDLAAWQKGGEAVRMMVQMASRGNPTEVVNLFANRNAAVLKEVLKSAIRFLKDLVKGGGMTPEIRRAVDGMQAVLDGLRVENKGAGHASPDGEMGAEPRGEGRGDRRGGEMGDMPGSYGLAAAAPNSPFEPSIPAMIQPLDRERSSWDSNDDESFRNPESIRQAITGEAPGEPGGSLPADVRERRKSKQGRQVSADSGVLAWAQDARRVLSPAPFVNLGGEFHSAGGEHTVIIDPAGERVVKITKPGYFGAQGADGLAYLQRWALHNRAFNDDVAFEGFVTLPGETEPRAVISQRFARGRDATQEEQSDFLIGKGFINQGEGRWIHPIRGIMLWDTITPGNAIMTGEGVVPIDLLLSPADRADLARVRKETGLGGQTLFAADPGGQSGGNRGESGRGNARKTSHSQGNLRAEQLVQRGVAQASGQEQSAYPQIGRGYDQGPWVRPDRPSSFTEIDRQDEELNQWARANGFFVEEAEVKRLAGLADKTFGGQEHDVWAFRNNGSDGVVIRRTRNGGYGLRDRTPGEYLERWRLSNAAFPDTAVSFLGYTKDARGNGVILTAQRYFEGVKKTQRDIDAAMAELGFERISRGEPSYRHPGTRVEIHDAKPDNIIFDKKGGMLPFDVWINDPADYFGTRADGEMADRLRKNGLAAAEPGGGKPGRRAEIDARRPAARDQVERVFEMEGMRPEQEADFRQGAENFFAVWAINLPKLPKRLKVESRGKRSVVGKYIRQPKSLFGEAILLAEHDPVNTAAHEITHWLDHQFMGGWDFASETESTPEMKRLMGALRKTKAAKELRAAARSSKGKSNKVSTDIRELALPREIFARAVEYATAYLTGGKQPNYSVYSHYTRLTNDELEEIVPYVRAVFRRAGIRDETQSGVVRAAGGNPGEVSDGLGGEAASGGAYELDPADSRAHPDGGGVLPLDQRADGNPGGANPSAEDVLDGGGPSGPTLSASDPGAPGPGPGMPREVIGKALEGMPPVYRAVYEEYLRGSSVGEIGRKLGISGKAVTNIRKEVDSRIRKMAEPRRGSGAGRVRADEEMAERLRKNGLAAADPEVNYDKEAVLEATRKAWREVRDTDRATLARIGRQWMSYAKEARIFLLGKEMTGKTLEELAKQQPVKVEVKYGGTVDFDNLGTTDSWEIHVDGGVSILWFNGESVWLSTTHTGGPDAYNHPETREKGNGGRVAYQMAQAFARNNGKRFIPDPFGVSDFARPRRWAQMLSSVLRFGDARHLHPYAEGVPEVPGWNPEDPAEVAAGRLAMAEYAYVKSWFPEIEKLRVSPDFVTLMNSDGKPLGDNPRAAFENLLQGRRDPRFTGIGASTLRRAIVTRLSSTGASLTTGRVDPGLFDPDPESVPGGDSRGGQDPGHPGGSGARYAGEGRDFLTGVLYASDPAAGRGGENAGGPSVPEVLAEYAKDDEIFRWPRSSGGTLRGVMRDVFPEARYLGEDTRADEREESGADTRHVFSLGRFKEIYVYETSGRGGEVWIDVSRLKEGDGGSGVYAAVGNYAFNTGKTFTGDPAGLSEAAVVRRTSAMIGLALRFGTTSFMEAAPEQIAGIPEKGIAPVEWKGDDAAKLESLIRSFLSSLQAKIPGIRSARYDFGTGRFLDRNKVPIQRRGGGSFDSKGSGAQGRNARAGANSLRRGIFLQSLVSGTGEERSGLLEHLGSGNRESATSLGIDRLFSADPSAPVPAVPREVIEEALRGMPPVYRRVHVLAQGGERDREIARRLAISERVVGYLRGRLAERVRKVAEARR